MTVEFPVFVASRDSGEMRKYGDLDEMARSLERIDVENGEYLAWDRRYRLLRMRISRGVRWLDLSAEHVATEEFHKALRRFADGAGLDEDPVDLVAAGAESTFDVVEKAVSERRRRRGWFERLRQRF